MLKYILLSLVSLNVQAFTYIQSAGDLLYTFREDAPETELYLSAGYIIATFDSAKNIKLICPNDRIGVFDIITTTENNLNFLAQNSYFTASSVLTDIFTRNYPCYQ